MGASWFMDVSIYDCVSASNEHVMTLIKSFRANPHDVLTPADLVPFDPATGKTVTWSHPDELNGRKYYIISGNHSIFAAQIICDGFGSLEQKAAFSRIYARRRARILNGNLSNIEYLRLSIECNEIIANTVYKEPLIEKLQQLRNQHEAFGYPIQGKSANWQVRG